MPSSLESSATNGFDPVMNAGVSGSKEYDNSGEGRATKR